MRKAKRRNQCPLVVVDFDAAAGVEDVADLVVAALAAAAVLPVAPGFMVVLALCLAAEAPLAETCPR